MSQSISSKLADLLQNGYDFQFGAYLSRGWRLLTSNAGAFIVYSLLIVVLSIVVMFIPILGWLALVFVLGPVFMAGYYYMAREADLEGETSLSTGFRGFSELGKILPVWILMFIITVICYIPYLVAVGPKLFDFYRQLMSNPAGMVGVTPPNGGVLEFLKFIPTYFTVSYLFALPFVLFSDLSGWNAMEASRKLITKKWLHFFGLYLVSAIIVGLGVLALGVGLLFTMAMMTLPVYAAYTDIVEDGDEREDEDELDHLIA